MYGENTPCYKCIKGKFFPKDDICIWSQLPAILVATPTWRPSRHRVGANTIYLNHFKPVCYFVIAQDFPHLCIY